jgi:predicted nucleotidyltransferase
LSGTGVFLAKLQADLREFIELLNSHGVEYLVVGGHAVAFHGHPRFTGDIDFFIRMTPENVQRILAVLNDFGFGSLNITEHDLLEPKRVLRLGRPPNQIDILTSISGVDFDAAWESRLQSIMDEQPVIIIGLSELLRNKKAAGRQKDLADVEKLLVVAKRRGAG